MRYLGVLTLLFFASCHSVAIKENNMFGNRVQELRGRIKQITVKTVSNSTKQNGSTIDDGTVVTYWDRKGNKIKQEDGYDTKYPDKTIFQYDGKLLTKSITTSNTNSPVMTNERRYDKKKREIENIWYFDNKLESKIIKKYDSKGNVISKQFIERDGKLRGTEIYEIDYKNKWVTVSNIDGEGKKKESFGRFQYDNKGYRIIDEYTFSKKAGVDCMKNEYDKRGNLLKFSDCDPNKKRITTTYQYAFDKVGNVVKQEKYYDGILVSTIFMEIVYW